MILFINSKTVLPSKKSKYTIFRVGILTSIYPAFALGLSIKYVFEKYYVVKNYCKNFSQILGRFCDLTGQLGITKSVSITKLFFSYTKLVHL